MRCGLLPSPRRTSTSSAFRSRCAERNFDGCETTPVKLIVFDFDETLTLMTYLIEEGDSQEVQQQIVRTNFETPWVKGSRISRLKQMLKDLSLDASGQRRALTVLTKNSAGAAAVLRLLQASDLAEHFDAVWTMPWRSHMDNAMYQQDGEWKGFNPPVEPDVTNKAELLSQLPSRLEAWLPQLEGDAENGLKAVSNLALESILLVDDQRANFQSASGAQIFRYCKVARYDAYYRSIGFVKNMGGIGAHCQEDYNTLKSFVESPSSCKETLQLHCVERHFPGSKLQSPVGLVVFDFDETLTLATFMPDDDAFLHSLNWQPEELRSTDWTVADLTNYNFESPYVEGSRIEKLKRLLSNLTGEDAQQRKLAILSWSDSGAVAIVNLLKLVGLADFFSAVWTMPYSSNTCCGAYRKDTEWRSFNPPVCELPDHKADVLRHLISHPAEWFPQLSQPEVDEYQSLLQLKLHGVVLVDDERASFQSSHENGAKVLRYCKVARYDETYRNCGALNQMGGIGAHSDRDYDTLQAFVERPWEFSQDPGAPESPELHPEGTNTEALRRIPSISEELRKMPRKKKARSHSSPNLRVSPAPRDGLRHQRNNSFSASPTFTFQLDEPEDLDTAFDLVLSES